MVNKLYKPNKRCLVFRVFIIIWTSHESQFDTFLDFFLLRKTVRKNTTLLLLYFFNKQGE